MLCKVTHCAGRVSANTRPHQLHWGDREMGTATSCIVCSQVAGLIQKSAETPRKHHLFIQLFFVQLSFVRRSCVVIVIVDRHVLSVHKRVRVRVHMHIRHLCNPLLKILAIYKPVAIVFMQNRTGNTNKHT